ncbi:MAG: hypothetical protein MRZ79_25690 [Bacteroidia bacterium]|nr:hypothetical protein [Bacteroidia bacterium]
MKRTSNKAFSWILIISFSLFLPLTSCKSRKKKAEEQARIEAEQAAINFKNEKAQLIAQLEKLMSSPIKDMEDWDNKFSRFQKFRSSEKFKGDSEVEAAMAKAEDFFESEKKRLMEESSQGEPNDYEDPNAQLKVAINQTFGDIANASSYEEANDMINSLMSRFASSDTPILIVIDQEGGDKAYDKPTTARKLLDYIKDKKENPYIVSEILLNRSDKIQSMELLLKK